MDQSTANLVDIGAYRAANRLKPLLRQGAVLRVLPEGGGFVLQASSGAELARATRTCELALLLDGMGSKNRPKGGKVVVALGRLAPQIATVRFQGETLGRFVQTAMDAEVARRCAAFDAEAGEEVTRG